MRFESYSVLCRFAARRHGFVVASHEFGIFRYMPLVSCMTEHGGMAWNMCGCSVPEVSASLTNIHIYVVHFTVQCSYIWTNCITCPKNNSSNSFAHSSNFRCLIYFIYIIAGFMSDLSLTCFFCYSRLIYIDTYQEEYSNLHLKFEGSAYCIIL